MSPPIPPPAAVALVEAVLLRTRLPELPLHEGASFVARVASRGAAGAASLVIAGELVAATVPEDVPAGATLRLTVAEVTPERVTLRMDALPPPPAPPPSPVRVAVEERAARRAGADAASTGVTLSYETPALGRLRIRVDSAPGSVAARIEVPARVLELARSRAQRLRDDLQVQTGSSAQVEVVPGRERSVDVRA